jgi:hypothetical protein
MKYLVLTLFLSIAFYIQATHEGAGSDIYVDHQGNGVYKITLVRYGAGSTLTSVPFTTNSTPSTFSLPKVQTTSVQLPQCVGNFTTDLTIFEGLVQFSTIPVNGLELTTNCTWPTQNNIQNWPILSITTTIYPGFSGHSPRFMDAPQLHLFNDSIAQINMGAYNVEREDSLHFEFSQLEPFLGSGSYMPGYSSNSPFGTNVPTEINSHSGLIEAINVPNGSYYIGIDVSAYKDGVKTCTVKRDFSICSAPTYKSQPKIELQNIHFTGADSSKTSNTYFFDMNFGDTLRFDISSFSTNSDSVEIKSFGNLLYNNSGWSGNCSGNHCALNFSPGGIKGKSSAHEWFSFAPKYGFIPTGRKSGSAHFIFQAYQEDSLGSYGYANVAVYVRVKKAQSIRSVSRIDLCNGQVKKAQILGDTTNLKWYPSIGVSNNTSASPFINPPQSQVYTVVNQNNGDSIQIHVNVGVAPKPILNKFNKDLIVANDKAFESINTLYNGATLYQEHDEMKITLVGEYYSHGHYGNCFRSSDTVKFAQLNRVANSAAFSGKSIRSSGNDVKSLTLQFLNRSYSIDTIRFLAPNPQYQKTALSPYLVIIDPQNQTIFSDTAIGYQNLVWKFSLSGLTLDQGTNYRIELHQFENEIVMFKPHAFPYTDKTITMKITGAEYDHFGVTKNNAFPYLEFEFASSIAMSENEIDAQVYPNPATDLFTIQLEGNWTFHLFDLSGRLLLEHTAKDTEQLNINNLPTGTYIYEIKSQNGGTKRDKLIIR